MPAVSRHRATYHHCCVWRATNACRLFACCLAACRICRQNRRSYLLTLLLVHSSFLLLPCRSRSINRLYIIAWRDANRYANLRVNVPFSTSRSLLALRHSSLLPPPSLFRRACNNAAWHRLPLPLLYNILAACSWRQLSYSDLASKRAYWRTLPYCLCLHDTYAEYRWRRRMTCRAQRRSRSTRQRVWRKRAAWRVPTIVTPSRSVWRVNISRV